ncbi:S-adenosylmethionine carrier 1 [Populus alba x Populus x berolinensis]|nr:S-adenosylmethionine carrier 1 [Populus alba x Populus x berolinensis]
MERLEKQHFKADMLNKYGTDLTKMAQEVKPDFFFSHVLAEPVTLASLNGILQGDLDQVVGRQKQIERVTQILCRRRKDNPCLVGDPGVGKTAIVEGLAANIVEGTVPSKLEGKKIFALDMARLVAGTKLHGDFEERLTGIVDEVKQSDGNIVLFIDELHTLVGNGQTLDAANILKPALARGELKLLLLLLLLFFVLLCLSIYLSMDAPAFQKISLGALEYKRCNSPMEPPCRFFASVSAAENKPFYFLHAVYEGIIAGGAAGVIAEAVLYPIDTIKTRLQASGLILSQFALVFVPHCIPIPECYRLASSLKRNSMYCAILSLAIHGGGKINLKGLYSGLAGNLAGVLPASAIFVGVYEPIKQKLLKSLPENLSALAQLTAGAIGGAASSLVRVPTEVVKQRMQTGQFASAPDAIRLIVSEEGFKGLYAGYGSFLLRDLPFDAIQFCIYEQMLMGYKLAAKRDPKDAEIAIVGAFAGAITGAMTTPLDVVKTRLMVQGSANQYKGIFDCARTIAKEEGTHALLKGLGPRVLWIGVGGAIFFGVLEKTKQILAQRKKRKEKVMYIVRLHGLVPDR